MIVPFQSDARYVRFLAGLPGLWAEVGVFDDPVFLATLNHQRAVLGLMDLDLRLPARPRRTSQRIGR